MVADQSAGADDGSHRLLIVPCVVVVLVLVLLVTACSAVSGAGDRDAADPSGVAGGAAGGSAGEDAEEVPGGSDGEGAGEIAEPVMAGDGRMIQPEGHTGLWFETEPADPLERLVYESQRFIGQPVTLEPIGDRALLPEWEDMPDPCHPEVLRRMGELGLEDLNSDDVGYGYIHCSVVGALSSGSITDLIAFEWGLVEDPKVFSSGGHIDPLDLGELGSITTGEMAEMFGCIGVYEPRGNGFAMVSTVSELSSVEGCNAAMLALQISLNVTGGKYVVSL